MNRWAFLEELRKELSFLPENDIEERLSFYGEMIDDRMEDGLSQEEAVAAIGSVEEIVSQVISDTPLSKIAKERLKPKIRLSFWTIFLIVLGSPVWLSVLISVFAVVFAVYASVWSIIISFWSVFVSLLASGFALTAASFIFFFLEKGLTGLVSFGVGLICIGLSIFVFYGCKTATRGILTLTKKLAKAIKNGFVRRSAQ